MPFEAIDGQDLDVEEWVAQMQAEFGYAQISIHDPASGRPGYAFTIGLEASRQVPELLCLGVAPEIASQLFSIFTDAQDTGAIHLEAGPQDVTGVVPDHTIRLRHVTADMIKRANSAKPQFHKEIKALVQLLLPDNQGRFPGDPACDPQVAAAQDVDWLLGPTPN